MREELRELDLGIVVLGIELDADCTLDLNEESIDGATEVELEMREELKLVDLGIVVLGIELDADRTLDLNERESIDGATEVELEMRDELKLVDLGIVVLGEIELDVDLGLDFDEDSDEGRTDVEGLRPIELDTRRLELGATVAEELRVTMRLDRLVETEDDLELVTGTIKLVDVFKLLALIVLERVIEVVVA
jgi:hypothetical protein